MPKPICVSCGRFFKPLRNGIRVLEQMPVGSRVQSLPGKEHANEWKPYKLWQADLYRCHGCGAEIVVGFGANPVCEKHMVEFEKTFTNFPPSVTVNDC